MPSAHAELLKAPYKAPSVRAHHRGFLEPQNPLTAPKWLLLLFCALHSASYKWPHSTPGTALDSPMNSPLSWCEKKSIRVGSGCIWRAFCKFVYTWHELLKWFSALRFLLDVKESFKRNKGRSGTGGSGASKELRSARAWRSRPSTTLDSSKTQNLARFQLSPCCVFAALLRSVSLPLDRLATIH